MSEIGPAVLRMVDLWDLGPSSLERACFTYLGAMLDKKNRPTFEIDPFVVLWPCSEILYEPILSTCSVKYTGI